MIELKEDEYANEEGLPICKKCNTPRFYKSDEEFCSILKSADKYIVRCMCECQIKEERKKEEQVKLDRIRQEFLYRKKLSLLGDRYQNITFADAILTKNNTEVFEKCKNYVEKNKEVYANNMGLYIYGDNSSGKTFLTACICNELVSKGYRCVYTNLATILNEIKSSYNGEGEGESVILSKLAKYQFAFIDDVGKEFLGREYNQATAKWAEKIFFEILNTRYNAKKPTVFTSNYSIQELATTLGLDKAIIERINEMSTRVLLLTGDDFRQVEADKKNALAKKLGI